MRPAEPGDAAAIRAVHEAAFGRAGEADLVEALSPVISLVAVDDEAGVVGHVLVSEVHVRDVPLLSLAPVGVLPVHQNRGHGRALVRAAVAAARETAYPLLVVLGHPAYYAKLGFEPARRLGLRVPEGVPREAWRAVRLPAFRDGEISGPVTYPPAFDGL